MFIPDSSTAYKVYEQKNAIQKDHTLGSYFIDENKYKELYGFKVEPNDIIVSCAGTIGETYVLPNDIREGIINQALMLSRLHLKEIQDFYLIYFDYILKAEAAKESKGTAIKNIPPFDILKSFLIPIPPLAEQLRIVAKIEELFAELDKIKESIEA
jgi:type I restriction enzyme S subunit